MSKTATIIAVKSVDVDHIPEGASFNSNAYNLDNIDAWAGPRPTLENDPSFRQVIPYVIIRNGNKILTYVRNSEGNESRLHGRASIGVGGHIDLSDARINIEGSIDLRETIKASAVRELEEEVGYAPDGFWLSRIGYLKVSETDVDKVHFGVVILWEALSMDVSNFKFENTMSKPIWLTPGELKASDLELETWSKLALDLI